MANVKEAIRSLRAAIAALELGQDVGYLNAAMNHIDDASFIVGDLMDEFIINEEK
jgi:hypothetical protein